MAKKRAREGDTSLPNAKTFLSTLEVQSLLENCLPFDSNVCKLIRKFMKMRAVFLRVSNHYIRFRPLDPSFTNWKQSRGDVLIPYWGHVFDCHKVPGEVQCVGEQFLVECHYHCETEQFGSQVFEYKEGEPMQRSFVPPETFEASFKTPHQILAMRSWFSNNERLLRMQKWIGHADGHIITEVHSFDPNTLKLDVVTVSNTATQLWWQETERGLCANEKYMVFTERNHPHRLKVIENGDKHFDLDLCNKTYPFGQTGVKKNCFQPSIAAATLLNEASDILVLVTWGHQTGIRFHVYNLATQAMLFHKCVFDDEPNHCERVFLTHQDLMQWTKDMNITDLSDSEDEEAYEGDMEDVDMESEDEC